MKTTLSLLFTLSLLTLTSAAPPMPISARSPAMHHTSKPTNQARGGTETAAGILNIIGGAIPGPAGQMVGDVGKGLSGGKAAGAAGAAGAGTGTAAAAGAATTGSAKAAKAGVAGGATKAAGKKADKAAA